MSWRTRAIVAASALFALAGVLGGLAPPASAAVEPLPVAGTIALPESTIFTNGYTRAGHNAMGHTRPRIVTHANAQYVVFFDDDTIAGTPQASIVIGKRTLPSGAWDFHDTGYTLNFTDDLHETPSLGIDPQGHIHLLWRTHTRPGQYLRYARSSTAGNIRSLVDQNVPNAGFQNAIIYPWFFQLNGSLHVVYKNDGGVPSRSRLWLKRYWHGNQRWTSPLKWPSNNAEKVLVDGIQAAPLPSRGQYFNVSQSITDGAIHLVWTWVPTGGSDTTIDLSYAVSRDGGVTWRNAAGVELTTPITYENSLSARLLPGMSATCINSVTTDGSGRVHIGYLRPDTGTAEPGTTNVWNYYHAVIEAGIVRIVKFTSFQTPVGHPCTEGELGGQDLVASGDSVVGVFRPGHDQPWHVWRSASPFTEHRFYKLGTASRGTQTPNIDHTRFTADGQIDMLNTYWRAGQATASPDVSVTSLPITDILQAP